MDHRAGYIETAALFPNCVCQLVNDRHFPIPDFDVGSGKYCLEFVFVIRRNLNNVRLG